MHRSCLIRFRLSTKLSKRAYPARSPLKVEIMLQAAPLHDVGKIGIPDAILAKPGKLDPHERNIMTQHTVIGASILARFPSTVLQAGNVIALSHHEKWDGSGYPNGLREENIPLWGRICAVADRFDAFTSGRPHRKAPPHEEACEILREDRASHFDPKVLDLFLANHDEVIAIQEKCRDTPKPLILAGEAGTTW